MRPDHESDTWLRAGAFVFSITQHQFDGFSRARQRQFLPRLRSSLVAKLPSLAAARPDLFEIEHLDYAVQQIVRAGFSEEIHVAALIALAIEDRNGAIDDVLAHPAITHQPLPAPGYPPATEELRFRQIFPALAGMPDEENPAFAPLMATKPLHAGAAD